MPYSVTHILIAIILVDLYRDHFAKHKKNFPLFTLLIAGIAGLLPDIDVVISYIAGLFGPVPILLEHGGIFHTPLFGIIFLVPAFIFLRRKIFKISNAFFIISAGIFIHIFLDFLLGGGGIYGIMPFWPFSTAQFKLFLLNQTNIAVWPEALDAMIFILWIWHEEIRHKIKDFI